MGGECAGLVAAAGKISPPAAAAVLGAVPAADADLRPLSLAL